MHVFNILTLWQANPISELVDNVNLWPQLEPDRLQIKNEKQQQSCTEGRGSEIEEVTEEIQQIDGRLEGRAESGSG